MVHSLLVRNHHSLRLIYTRRRELIRWRCSCTGTIIACLGAETSSGDFEVFEYLYPGLPPQKPLEEKEGEGEWIALVSGLEMGNSSVVGDLRSELLVEWLNGELGDQEVQSPFPLLQRAGTTR